MFNLNFNKQFYNSQYTFIHTYVHKDKWIEGGKKRRIILVFTTQLGQMWV